MTVSNITTDPTRFQNAFLNQPWVQEDLGVPLNFTLSSAGTVEAFFARTGDPMRRSLSSLESVLDSGVNVALIYGDRDYRCNCTFHPFAKLQKFTRPPSLPGPRHEVDLVKKI